MSTRESQRSSAILRRLFFTVGGAAAVVALANKPQKQDGYLSAGGHTSEDGERMEMLLNNALRSVKPESVSRSGNLKASVRGRPELPRAQSSSGTERQAGWRDMEWRKLQEACANSTAFFVSSTAFPDAEGCYESTHESVYMTLTEERAIAVVPISDAEGTQSNRSHWVSGTVESFVSSAGSPTYTLSMSMTQECVSDGFEGAEVHPADIDTWYCHLESHSNLVEVDDTEFSVTCGCLVTPAPTAPFTPTSVTDDDVDISGGSTCGETESFVITKAFDPNLEGCFEYTGIDYTSGGYEFIRTGSDNETDMAVFPLIYNNDLNALWTLGTFAEDPQDVLIYCISNEASSEVHPADASWTCDLNGTSDFFSTVTIDTFSIDCRCNSITTAPYPNTDGGLSMFSEFPAYATVVISLTLVLADLLTWVLY